MKIRNAITVFTVALLLQAALQGEFVNATAQQFSGSSNATDQGNPRLVVQIGPTEGIASAAFSTDGRLLVTGGGKVAVLWDVSTGRELRRLVGHKNEISSVDFSPDGRLILTGSKPSYELDVPEVLLTTQDYGKPTKNNAGSGESGNASRKASAKDFSIRIWDAATGTEIKHFAQEGGVGFAKFSPDGLYILTDHAVLSADTGQLLFRYEGARASFSKDSRVLTAVGDAIVTYEVAAGRELKRFRLDAGPVVTIAFSADGRFVLTGSGKDYEKEVQNYQVILWDAENGRRLREFKGHKTGITAAAFSPDGKFVATGGGDSSGDGDARVCLDCAARLWDTATGRQLRLFKEDKEPTPVASLSFSPDGRRLMMNSAIWEPTTGRKIISAEAGGVNLFSPRGEFAFIRGDLWDADAGQKVWTLYSQAQAVRSLDLSADGGSMLMGLQDFGPSWSKPVLWDLSAGKELWRFPDESNFLVGAVAFSPDARSFAAGGVGPDGKSLLRLYDATTLEAVRDFTGPPGVVASVRFSPSGRYILTGGQDFRSAEKSKDEPGARLWDAASGRLLQNFLAHSDAEEGIAFIATAFSSDERFVSTACVDGNVYVWDTQTGKEVRRFNIGGRDSISAFSPDGSLMVVSTQRDLVDAEVTLWDVGTGQRLRRFTGPEREWITSVAFSPDGRLILAGSGHAPILIVASGMDFKNTAYLWDAQTGREVGRYEHYSGIQSVSFTHDGRYAITAGDDGTARFWNVATHREACRLISFKDGTWVVVDPDGRFDTNNLEDIRGLHWILPDDQFKPLPLEIFMRDYYEPRLLPRLLAGEQLPPIRDLSSLNRVQPTVSITKITRQAGDAAVVSVYVADNAATLRRSGGAPVTSHSGVYDLRLFRDGQQVGVWPAGGAGKLSRPTDAEAHAGVMSGEEEGPRQELRDWRAASGVELDANGRRTIDFRVKLPRGKDVSQIEFTAYAFNEDRVKGETARWRWPDEMAAKLPKAQTVRGRAYIISVGVNASENPEWVLQYAASDARQIQRVVAEGLRQGGQYEVVTVPLVADDEVRDGRTVEVRDATKAKVRAVLDLLAGRPVEEKLKQSIPKADELLKATPDDLVLISFSSHGYADENGVFYLLPYDVGADSRQVTPEMLRHCISSDELSEWLRDVDGGEMVLIIDACHAASFTGREFKPGPMGSRGLGQLSYDKGMRILAATQAKDVAVEVGGSIGQGLLTYALAEEGLEKREADFRKKDGVIGLKEWLEYGEWRVPSLYEDVAGGKLKGVNRAVLAGELKVRPAYQQQPSLFDFARRAHEVVLDGAK